MVSKDWKMVRNAANTDVTQETDMARPAAAPTPTPPASILSKLKFRDIKRSAAISSVDPAMRARAKIKDAINEQIHYVNGELNNSDYEPMRMKYITDETGKRVRVSAKSLRRMIWYFQQDGLYYTEIRYGSSPVDFGAGSAVEAGPELADLIETYELVLEAVDKGELDGELVRLAAARGRGKSKKAPIEPPASPLERLQGRAARR